MQIQVYVWKQKVLYEFAEIKGGGRSRKGCSPPARAEQWYNAAFV